MGHPPAPGADFPPSVTNAWAQMPAALWVLSLERRADYQSALKAQRAAEILEAAARRNLLPQLDLNLEAGYAGLEEGSHLRRYYGALDPRVAEGPNLLGTVSFEWPFRNRTARGLLAQRQAARQQTQIRAEELARTIHAGIQIAMSELAASQGELEQAELAARNFQRALEAEKAKVRLRTATILDVINLADRLYDAQLAAVAARARHAIALARVRFETGTLVRPGMNVESPLTLEDLTTLPSWSPNPAKQ
jgi:outer membrane protein TolC